MRALLSVYDKTGIVDLGRGLHDLGWELVSSSNTDGTAPFAPQTVADTDPDSPTYVGGPMGRVPYFHTSPLIRTEAQALATGRTILNRVKSHAADLNVDSVAAMDLIMEIEDRFEIDIPINLVSDMTTVADLVALVDRQLKAREAK